MDYGIFYCNNGMIIMGKVEKNNKSNVHVHLPVFINIEEKSLQLSVLLEPSLSNDQTAVLNKASLMFEPLEASNELVKAYENYVSTSILPAYSGVVVTAKGESDKDGDVGSVLVS